MVRETSIECYNEIKSNGLLTKRRLEVYEAIYNSAPCTASEVFKANNLETNQSGRFTELRNLGVIYEVRTRKCNITNRTAIEWDLTDRLPKMVKPNSNSKPKNLKKCISYIINKMNEDGVLFVDIDFLKNIEN
jgi:hypothetical protein